MAAKEKTPDTPSDDLPVVYEYNGTRLTAPPMEYNTAEKARTYYATKYAELATASIETPVVKEGFRVIVFRKALTTKG